MATKGHWLLAMGTFGIRMYQNIKLVAGQETKTGCKPRHCLLLLGIYYQSNTPVYFIFYKRNKRLHKNIKKN